MLQVIRMRRNLICILVFLLGCQPNIKDGNSLTSTIDSLKFKINSQIYDSLKYIIDAPSMRLSNIGCIKLPKNYETFLSIKKNGTRQEIELLLKHEDPKIRSYSFWALRDKKFPILPTLFSFVNDTAMVETSFGCLGNIETVGEFCYWKIWEKNAFEKRDTCYLTNAEIDSLNVYVLKENANKYLIEKILFQYAMPERTYSMIKERALQNTNSSYAVALARYQKQDDKRFIEYLLTNSRVDYSYKYKIIQVFPHKDFFEILVGITDSLIKIKKLEHGIIGLYKANAKYSGTISVPLFNKALNYAYENHDNRLPENWPTENNQERALIVGVLDKTSDKALKKYRDQLKSKMIKEGFDYMLDFYATEEDNYTELKVVFGFKKNSIFAA
jgi:hypothetical protein